MSKEFKISVIIPCYNVESRVRVCLDSLVGQTIGIEYLEIILVDDASTDRTVDVLKEYEMLYPDNIMIIKCSENGRQGKARNIGLGYSSGEWISFVDSDDMVHIQMYEVLKRVIDRFDPELINFRSTSDDGEIKKTIDIENIDSYVVDIGKDIEREEILFGNNMINDSCWHKLYKRELVERSGVRFSEGVSYEEPLFTYPMRFFTNRMAVVEHKLYYYYFNPEGTVNKTLADPSKITDHMNVQLQTFEFMKKTEFYLIYRDEIELYFIHRFAYESDVFTQRKGFLLPYEYRVKIREVLDEEVPNWRENRLMYLLSEEEKEWLLGL